MEQSFVDRSLKTNHLWRPQFWCLLFSRIFRGNLPFASSFDDYFSPGGRGSVHPIAMGDWGHVAVMDYSDEDDERRGENDDMDDLGEDESDEEESDNDDDEEDENDDGIESEEEEEVEVHDKSVHKFIRTFHNGDYDQEFVNALSSDRAVPLPTTQTTQAS